MGSQRAGEDIIQMLYSAKPVGVAFSVSDQSPLSLEVSIDEKYRGASGMARANVGRIPAQKRPFNCRHPS